MYEMSTKTIMDNIEVN